MRSLALEFLLHRPGDKALDAAAAVVGHHDQLRGDRLHLVFQDEELRGAGPYDGEDLVARSRQGARYRVESRYADAAPHAEDTPEGLDLRGDAEWPDHIEHRVADLETAELERGGPNHLEYQEYPTIRGVPVRQRQGKALALLGQPQDDELPGIRLMRDHRSGHAHGEDLLGELPLLEYLEGHQDPPSSPDSRRCMDLAARLPAPIASMTVAEPVTMSPPAYTPGMDVSPVSGSTSM